MRSFFEEHKLDNSNGLSKSRVKKIRHSVLAQVEECKPMKKRFNFKPLVIAAAAIATMALSAVTVNALSSGDNPLIKINGKMIDAYYTSYIDEFGFTVDIYMVDFPEEILMNPPKNADPAPVGELRVLEIDDTFVLVDEAGDEFQIGGGSTWAFGKYVQITKNKEEETGYDLGYDGGGVREEYGIEILYSPNDKSLSIKYYKNLFDTIADMF